MRFLSFRGISGSGRGCGGGVVVRLTNPSLLPFPVSVIICHPEDGKVSVDVADGTAVKATLGTGEAVVAEVAKVAGVGSTVAGVANVAGGVTCAEPDVEACATSAVLFLSCPTPPIF